MWDAATGDKLREMTCGGDVFSVALSADGSRIVTGDYSNKVTLSSEPLPSLTTLHALPHLFPASHLGSVLAPWRLLVHPSQSGKTLLTHAAALGREDWIAALTSRNDAPPLLIAAGALHRDGTGACALDCLAQLHKAQGIELLLQLIMRHTPPSSLATLLKASPVNDAGAHSTFTHLCSAYPAAVAACIAGGPNHRPLFIQAYDADDTPSLKRLSASKLIHDSGRLLLKVATGPLPSESALWGGGDLGMDAADSVDVHCGIIGIPGLVSPDGAVFAALAGVAKQCPHLIVSEPMRAAIDFKWQAFGSRMWLSQMAVWGALATSWITGLYLLLVPAPPLSPSHLAASSGPTAGDLAIGEQGSFIPSISDGAVAFAPVPLLTLFYVWEEALQLRSTGFCAYLSTPAKYVNLLLIGVVATLSLQLARIQGAVVNAVDNDLNVQLGALGTFVVLLKGGQLMRGNTRMAFLMTMLTEILIDMIPFLLLQAAVVLTFSFSSVLLHISDDASADEFGTLSLAVFASYNLLIHAAGTDNADVYFRTSTVFLLLSSVSTLLVNVVMLNALIAIMGDTYERVSETRIERGLQQRAELLVEYESMMLIKNASNGFGSWLHAVQRKDAAGAMGEGDVWAGQLRRLKDDVKGVKDDVKGVKDEDEGKDGESGGKDGRGTNLAARQCGL